MERTVDKKTGWHVGWIRGVALDDELIQLAAAESDDY
jgi:hypothetical protein